MSEKNIRAILFGCGASGRLAVKYMVEQGVEVIGAVGNRNNIGRDVGELAGIEPIGVPLEKDALAVIERANADIAVVASAANSMEDLEEMFTMLVEHDLNIVTVCGEPYFPWAYNAEIADRLDALAKEHGVTILGTGIEDPFWQSLPIAIASAVSNIKTIRGENTALLEALGPASLGLCHAGKTLEEFNAGFEGAEPEPTAFLATLKCIAHELDLHIIDSETEFSIEPLIAKEDISFPEYDLFIEAGKLSGMVEKLAFHTEEGIALCGDFYAKVTEPGDEAPSKWVIEGEPTIENYIPDMHGEFTTSTALVNRIPDVINAEPGFLTVAEMPKLTYHSKPLPEYLK